MLFMFFYAFDFVFPYDQHFKSVAEGQKSDTPPASRTATAELERLTLD